MLSRTHSVRRSQKMEQMRCSVRMGKVGLVRVGQMQATVMVYRKHLLAASDSPSEKRDSRLAVLQVWQTDFVKAVVVAMIGQKTMSFQSHLPVKLPPMRKAVQTNSLIEIVRLVRTATAEWVDWVGQRQVLILALRTD